MILHQSRAHMQMSVGVTPYLQNSYDDLHDWKTADDIR